MMDFAFKLVIVNGNVKDVACAAYTWHTAHQSPGNKLWDKQCYLVPRGAFLWYK